MLIFLVGSAPQIQHSDQGGDSIINILITQLVNTILLLTLYIFFIALIERGLGELVFIYYAFIWMLPASRAY
jgi:hypothetical protein